MINKELQNLIDEYIETSVSSILLNNSLKTSSSKKISLNKMKTARERLHLVSEKLFMALQGIDEETKQELKVELEFKKEEILAEFRRESYLKEKLIIILESLRPNTSEYISSVESFKKVEKSLQEKAIRATSYEKIIYYLKGLSVSSPKKVS